MRRRAAGGGANAGKLGGVEGNDLGRENVLGEEDRARRDLDRRHLHARHFRHDLALDVEQILGARLEPRIAQAFQRTRLGTDCRAPGERRALAVAHEGERRRREVGVLKERHMRRQNLLPLARPRRRKPAAPFTDFRQRVLERSALARGSRSHLGHVEVGAAQPKRRA